MSSYYVSDFCTNCIIIIDKLFDNFRRLPFAVRKGLLYKESADCIYF